MGSTTFLTAYLPIPMPWPGPIYDETFRGILYDMLDELCNLSEALEFYLGEYGTLLPKVELLENHKLVQQTTLEKWFSIKTIETHEFIKISGSISVPSELKGVKFGDRFSLVNHRNEVIYKDTPPAVQIHKMAVSRLFEKRTYDLVIAANIAHAGSLDTSAGVIIQDDVIITKPEKMNVRPLREASLLVADTGWPKLLQCDLANVWKWLTKLEGFVDGFGENSTTRALNAFTYLFDDRIESDPALLLWALVGVEALYVKGQSSLLEQVREKTKVLLGSPETYKKKLSRMYDYRSRFVHGDLNFPGRHTTRDEQEGNYLTDLSESTSLAIAILTSSLQELVKRDWKGLGFSYTVNQVGD